MKKKNPIWTNEVVKSLNATQADPMFHGYTCGGKDCIRSEENDWGKLVATPDGWVCPCGEYKQNWYHRK